MKHRTEDPDDVDATPPRRNGSPWWVRALAWIGLPAFLVLFLLGAIPGLQSPLVLSRSQADLLERHDRDTGRILRLICRGIWRGVPEVQEQCDERPR